MIPNGWIKQRNQRQVSEESFCLPVFFTSISASNVAAAVGFIPAVAIGVAGVVVNELDQVHHDLIVRKMKPGKRINTFGGPAKWQADLYNETQIINMDWEFEPLRIETP